MISVEKQTTHALGCKGALDSARDQRLFDFDVRPFVFSRPQGQEGLRIVQRDSSSRSYLLCDKGVVYILAVNGVSQGDTSDAVAQTARLRSNEDAFDDE